MQRLQFFTATTLTGSGQTPAFSIAEQTVGNITLNIQSVSGTGTPLLSLWLQESDDGGTTWYDVISNTAQVGAATKTEGAVTTNKRNVCLDAAAAATYRACYANLCGDYYRLKYEISGTNPQFAVSVTLQAK